MKGLVVVFLAFSALRAEEPLDLAALLAEAERANPDLLARTARAQAAEEIPSQRGALPDPMLSISYTNDGLDAFTLGSSQFSNVTARWDQTIPARGCAPRTPPSRARRPARSAPPPSPSKRRSAPG